MKDVDMNDRNQKEIIKVSKELQTKLNIMIEKRPSNATMKEWETLCSPWERLKSLFVSQ